MKNVSDVNSQKSLQCEIKRQVLAMLIVKIIFSSIKVKGANCVKSDNISCV